MRDLGIVLDEKLTFAAHIDQVVRKASRALGLMMRSFQTGKHGRSFYQCDAKAIVSVYCANVRSIMEYGSVIWGGAAECHVKRLECVQFKFLTWLSARCRTGVPLRYDELLRHFRLSTLLGRRRQHDLIFFTERALQCCRLAISAGSSTFSCANPPFTKSDAISCAAWTRDHCKGGSVRSHPSAMQCISSNVS